MDNYIIAEINEFSQKENGYLALFCVRLGNFCVKADPQAMLSATIHLESAEYNFEDVADATRPNDYTFDVTPKNENNLSAIVQGVAEVHPEFKVSVKIKEYDEGFEERHIIYTMPEVNKERRDLLNEVCKTFHKECAPFLHPEPGGQYPEAGPRIREQHPSGLPQGSQRALRQVDRPLLGRQTADHRRGQSSFPGKPRRFCKSVRSD